MVWLEIARECLKFKQCYYVHDLHGAHKSNKTIKVKFTVYWPVINHVTVVVVVFFLLTNMYKTIKALEGITWNNGNTLILPIIIVQGTVRVYIDWLVFSGHVHTLPDNFSCRHESMNTYPICDSSPSRSTRRSLAPLQKSRRNHRPYTFSLRGLFSDGHPVPCQTDINIFS